MSIKKSRTKRSLLDEDKLLKTDIGIPFLLRMLQEVQQQQEEDSIVLIGKVLKTWQLWAKNLAPSVDLGTFLVKLQTFHSSKSLKKWLQEERKNWRQSFTQFDQRTTTDLDRDENDGPKCVINNVASNTYTYADADSQSSESNNSDIGEEDDHNFNYPATQEIDIQIDSD